jgi:hypothetical protein
MAKKKEAARGGQTRLLLARYKDRPDTMNADRKAVVLPIAILIFCSMPCARSDKKHRRSVGLPTDAGHGVDVKS